MSSLIEQHLTRLMEDLELPPVPPKDEAKAFQLQFGPEMSVTLKEVDGQIFLFSKIGALPQQKREELFILLMKANLLGQGTGGSAIGLDPAEKFLTLSLAIPYDMNYKAFRETIEDFTNFTDYWRKELIRHAEEAEKSLFGQ
ncbi:MAG: type III secretion system chaperone [Chlamydiales bacterium]|nr:type III secretion system chaperone [Chlamydiales bacterium]